MWGQEGEEVKGCNTEVNTKESSFQNDFKPDG